MRYLNFILTVIAVALAVLVWKSCSLETALKGFSDSCQSLISSNQSLINSQARLEAELSDLRKEISSIKESLGKK